jgi:carbonic anhydrase
MRRVFRAFGLFALLVALPAGCHEPIPDAICMHHPLEALKDGNERFALGRPWHDHQDAARRADTAAHGQHPFATVLACSDSRVPVELIFDQGIGDLFVVRVAGNVCGRDETGSIEYGIEHLHTPLLVVLGHAECGAVTAAVEGADEHGSIPELLSHIAPAAARTRAEHPELSGRALIDAAVRTNVWHSIEELYANSAGLRHAVLEGKVRIVGAVYDIRTAKVEWLGPHPQEAQLVAGHSEGHNGV